MTRSAGSNQAGSHFGEGGTARGGGGVACTEIQFAVKFGNGVRLEKNYFQTIREFGFCSFRPADFTLSSKFRDRIHSALRLCSHHAASCADFATGLRKTIARFCGCKYFLAAS